MIESAAFSLNLVSGFSHYADWDRKAAFVRSSARRMMSEYGFAVENKGDDVNIRNPQCVASWHVRQMIKVRSTRVRSGTFVGVCQKYSLYFHPVCGHRLSPCSVLKNWLEKVKQGVKKYHTSLQWHPILLSRFSLKSFDVRVLHTTRKELIERRQSMVLSVRRLLTVLAF